MSSSVISIFAPIGVCESLFKQTTWYSWNVTWYVKNVIYDVFSNARKVSLNWSLEATFANYISSCKLQVVPNIKCTPQDYKLSQPWKEKMSHLHVMFAQILCSSWWKHTVIVLFGKVNPQASYRPIMSLFVDQYVYLIYIVSHLAREV
jgi:hypothetical protein